jgi:hypothetical protein
MSAPLTFNQRDLGHGSSGTILHPVVLLALIVAIVLVWRLPRKYVGIPLLLITFLVPRGQVLYVAGIHFYVRFIILLVGGARLLREKWRVAGGINTIDKIFCVWLFYRVASEIITNGMSALAEQLNFGVQGYCGYFLLRSLIRNEEDIARIAKVFVVVVAVLGVCMVFEDRAHVNIFGYLGGAPLSPEIRNGKMRAQATLGHSILAGSLGATLVPLFFWLWKSGHAKKAAIAGIVGSTMMVLSSSSSTPMLAYAAGVLGLSLWPIRKSMQSVRWGIVIVLAGLQLAMNAPVWFVIAHVDLVGGSGGYDRAELVDVFMKHIRDWWLFGTNQNGNWGYDMWDQSNQFVAEGECGGLVTIVCFIAMISQCYSRLGKMRRRLTPRKQWLVWSLGAVMLAHIFAYFGVAYWDQNQIWWFAFLAMISAATPSLKEPVAVRDHAINESTINLEPTSA